MRATGEAPQQTVESQHEVLWTGDDERAREALAQRGVRVSHVPVEACLSLVETRAPDVLVLSGASAARTDEVTQALRARQPGATLPVLVISGAAPPAKRRAGLVSYLSTELAPNALAAVIHERLEAAASFSRLRELALAPGDIDAWLRSAAEEEISAFLLTNAGAIAIGPGDRVAPSPELLRAALAQAPATEPQPIKVLELPANRLLVMTEPRASGAPTELAGLQMAVVHPDRAQAEALCAELSAAGAAAHAVGVEPADVARVAGLAPSLVVIAAAALQQPATTSLWQDARLASASWLVLDESRLGTLSGSHLLEAAARLGASGRELRERLANRKLVVDRIESFGAAGWLREVGRCEQPLTLVLRSSAGRSELTLVAGKIRGASFVAASGGSPQQGQAALQATLAMSCGRVLVGSHEDVVAHELALAAPLPAPAETSDEPAPSEIRPRTAVAPAAETAPVAARSFKPSKPGQLEGKAKAPALTASLFTVRGTSAANTHAAVPPASAHAEPTSPSAHTLPVVAHAAAGDPAVVVPAIAAQAAREEERPTKPPPLQAQVVQGGELPTKPPLPGPILQRDDEAEPTRPPLVPLQVTHARATPANSRLQPLQAASDQAATPPATSLAVSDHATPPSAQPATPLAVSDRAATQSAQTEAPQPANERKATQSAQPETPQPANERTTPPSLQPATLQPASDHAAPANPPRVGRADAAPVKQPLAELRAAQKPGTPPKQPPAARRNEAATKPALPEPRAARRPAAPARPPLPEPRTGRRQGLPFGTALPRSVAGHEASDRRSGPIAAGGARDGSAPAHPHGPHDDETPTLPPPPSRVDAEQIHGASTKPPPAQRTGAIDALQVHGAPTKPPPASQNGAVDAEPDHGAPTKPPPGPLNVTLDDETPTRPPPPLQRHLAQDDERPTTPPPPRLHDGGKDDAPVIRAGAHATADDTLTARDGPLPLGPGAPPLAAREAHEAPHALDAGPSPVHDARVTPPEHKAAAFDVSLARGVASLSQQSTTPPQRPEPPPLLASVPHLAQTAANSQSQRVSMPPPLPGKRTAGTTMGPVPNDSGTPNSALIAAPPPDAASPVSFGTPSSALIAAPPPVAAWPNSFGTPSSASGDRSMAAGPNTPAVAPFPPESFAAPQAAAPVARAADDPPVAERRAAPISAIASALEPIPTAAGLPEPSEAPARAGPRRLHAVVLGVAATAIGAALALLEPKELDTPPRITEPTGEVARATAQEPVAPEIAQTTPGALVPPPVAPPTQAAPTPRSEGQVHATPIPRGSAAAELLQQAKQAREASRLKDAEALLSELLTSYPHDFGARYHMALTLVRLRRFEEARAHLARAMELNSESSSAWLLQGDIFLQEGRRVDALRAWNRCIAVQADNPTCRERLARWRLQ